MPFPPKGQLDLVLTVPGVRKSPVFTPALLLTHGMGSHASLSCSLGLGNRQAPLKSMGTAAVCTEWIQASISASPTVK